MIPRVFKALFIPELFMYTNRFQTYMDYHAKMNCDYIGMTNFSSNSCLHVLAVPVQEKGIMCFSFPSPEFYF